MDFGLTPEQQELYDAVLAFARDQLAGDPRPLDETDGFDRAAWRKAAAFGLLGLPVPAEYGGQGRDLLSTLLAMEARGRGCPDNGLVFSHKCLKSMLIACRKRGISVDILRASVERIERDLFQEFQDEAPTTRIGDKVLAELFAIDSVAYVRFASVYKQFDTVSDFQHIIDSVTSGATEPSIHQN